MMTVYLDESATDSGSSPIAVVGGVLLNFINYSELKEEWQRLLADFPELSPALHMKDFGSHGRLATLGASRRLAIFSRASEIISKKRTYSISASLSHGEYASAFSSETQRIHSQYELCVLLVALAIGKASVFNNYSEPIPFVLDEGNAYAEQVRRAHKEIRSIQKNSPQLELNIGGLTFEDDRSITALQAADIVCWGARRTATGTPFLAGTEPIKELLTDPSYHLSVPLEPSAMHALEAEFKSRIR
jgi:hypothetical protein